MQGKRSLKQMGRVMFIAFTAVILTLAWNEGAEAERVIATFSSVTTSNGPSGVNAHHLGIPDGAPILGTIIYDTEVPRSERHVPQSTGEVSWVSREYVSITENGVLRPFGVVVIAVAGQVFELPLSQILVADFASGTPDVLGTATMDQVGIVFGSRFEAPCGAFNGVQMILCGGSVTLFYPNSVIGDTLPTALLDPLFPVPWVQGENVNAHLSYVTMGWSDAGVLSGQAQGYLDGQDESTGGTAPTFGGANADNPLLPTGCTGTAAEDCLPPWDFVILVPAPDADLCIDGSDLSCWFPMDPLVAIGYDYQVAEGSPKIAAVNLPVLGDNNYRVHLFDGSVDQIIQGGEPHTFPEGGVDRFQVLDIETGLGLNPDDPTAFVTHLAFASTGVVHLTMNPIVGNSEEDPIPRTVTIDIKPGKIDDPTKINPTTSFRY